MRWLNQLMPPNVYYIEISHSGARVRAKYALVSLPQLEQLTGPTTLNPYFWARFAQPTGLLWSRDPAIARCVADALVEAILTTDRAVRPLLPPGPDAASLWTRALRESYRTELRAEKPERAAEIVRGDLERYRRVSAALGPREPDGSAARAARRWFLRRCAGKGAEPPAPRQGVLDIRRRRRLSRLEDQPACRGAGRVQRLGAAPSIPGGPIRALAARPSRRRPLVS